MWKTPCKSTPPGVHCLSSNFNLVMEKNLFHKFFVFVDTSPQSSQSFFFWLPNLRKDFVSLSKKRFCLLRVTGDLSNNSKNSRKCFYWPAFICLQSNLITDSHGSLLFDPPLLDFGDWYSQQFIVCSCEPLIPTLLSLQCYGLKVNIKNNRINEKPINILSISGSSRHIHCSLVEDNVSFNQHPVKQTIFSFCNHISGT